MGRWVVGYLDWDLHWVTLLASACRHSYRARPADWLVRL